MKRDQDYRYNLKSLIGSNIILDCKDFMLTKRRPNGRVFVLMKAPVIVKGRNLNKNINRRIGHLWCEIDGHKTEYLKLAKSIRVMGRVYEYQKKTGTTQVGVKAYNVEILQYAKGVEEKYRINGKKLSNHEMDKLLLQQEELVRERYIT